MATELVLFPRLHKPQNEKISRIIMVTIQEIPISCKGLGHMRLDE